MNIYLSPIKNLDPKPMEEFAVCDIESMKWTNFLCIGHFDGEHFWWFKKMDDFIDMVRDTRQKIYYAHFGGKFDFMFLFQWMVVRPDVRIEGMIPRGSGLLCFTAVFTDRMGKEIHRTEFRDSSALLPFGLKSLCESFKVDHPKLDWDHEKTTKVTKELIRYLQHDCVGLYEVIQKFQEWPLIQRAGSAFTMAGQAMKVYRTFLKDPIPSLPPKVDAFVRTSYFGGRTEIFKPLFTGPGKLYCYDVNSLYPTIMQNNDFPTKFLYFTQTYHPKKMGFYKAMVTVPHTMHIPPLPTVQKINKSEKLIFPTGTFVGVWSTKELEYAKSQGCKINKIYHGAIFQNGGPIFKEYIDTLYKMRMKAKSEKDGVTDILTKLLMNSLYGRFGLNRFRTNLVFDNGQENVKLHHEMTLKGRTVRLMSEDTVLTKTFTNVAIAAWVTSLARIHMHKIFMQDPENIYYTDTDSLFTTTKMKTGDGLGELKEEYSAKQACFLLPKTYFVESGEKIFDKYDEKSKKWLKNSCHTKLTMKGFDKKKIGHFQFEDYFLALEGELKQLSVIHDAKFATFKSAIKKDTFLSMMPESPKQIRSTYDKRHIYKKHGEYFSDPLHISG